MGNNKRVALISALFLAGLLFQFGYWYEAYEALVQNLIAGTFSNPPYHIWLTTNYTFLYPLLSVVQSVVNYVLVLPVLMLVSTLFWFTAFNFLLYKKLATFIQPSLVSVGVMLLLDFVLLGDSLIYMSCTRSSLLGCFTLLLLIFEDTSSNKKNIVPALGVCFIFLLRIEMIYVSGLFLLLFFLLGGKKPNPSRVALFVGVFMAVVLIVFSVEHKFTKHIGRLFEYKYEYAMDDKKDFIPLAAMHTVQDSLTYTALRSFFLNDSSRVNVLLAERLLHPQNLTYQFTNDAVFSKNAQRTYGSLKELVIEHRVQLYLVLLLLFLSVFATHKKRSACLQFLLLSTAISFLVFVCFKSTMFSRVFSPVIAMVCFIQLAIVVQCGSLKKSRGLPLLFALILLLLCFLKFTQLKIVSQQLEAEEMFCSKANLDIEQSTGGNTIVMLAVKPPYILPMKVFSSTTPSLFRHTLIADAGSFMYFDFFSSYYETKYPIQLFELPSIYKYLKTNKNEVVLLAQPERVALLQQYLKIFYGLELKAERLNKLTDSNYENWDLYSVTKN